MTQASATFVQTGPDPLRFPAWRHLDMGGYKITNGGDGTDLQDFATMFQLGAAENKAPPLVIVNSAQVLSTEHDGLTLVWKGTSTASWILSASAAAGTSMILLPTRAGMIKVEPAAGAARNSGFDVLPFSLHNGTAYTWGPVFVQVWENVDGLTAQWVLVGPTAIIA